MAYRIMPLPSAAFAPYRAMSAAALASMGARRVIATSDRGFPCRVSLDDATAGESLLLMNFVSHDVANPYRTAHAIYVREGAEEAQPHVDCLPRIFAGRVLSLRGFDAAGMLASARLAQPGEVETGIGELFANPEIACIHAHNAAYGCFAARIERHGDLS